MLARETGEGVNLGVPENGERIIVYDAEEEVLYGTTFQSAPVHR